MAESTRGNSRPNLAQLQGLSDPLLTCNYRLVFNEVPKGIFSRTASAFNSAMSTFFVLADANISTDNMDGLSLSCRSATVPASTIEAIQVEHRGFRCSYPGRRMSSNSVTVEFMESQALVLSMFFTAWLDIARDINDGTSDVELRKGRMSLLLFRNDGEQSGGYSYYGVWPTEVGDMSLNGQSSDIVPLSVTFAYDLCFLDKTITQQVAEVFT
jgi:hypothetical protein